MKKKHSAVNATELARLCGVSVNKIRRWKKLGRLPTDPDGLFPVPYSIEIYKTLEKKTNYSKRVTELNTESDQQPEHNSYPPVEDDPMPPEEQEPFDREIDVRNLSIGERIIEQLQNRIKGSDQIAYQWGRALNEVVKSRKQLIELLQMEGKFLPRQEVESWVQGMSRQNRDVWLNWPMINAPEMAEELGVDGKLLHDVLLKYVRKNLERVATLPSEYDPKESEEVNQKEIDHGH